ncbi:hypothetical protein [Labrenzia sp. VG12]|uniref:hypothetical protein n=1 Tax=Labrenzia sp. VG12 TaxID=2021862 RepID=UPI0012FD4123|nr:hypothetical protein [Labrenzia sp. VG12]
MVDTVIETEPRTASSNVFPPVVLFVLAAGVLMLMSAWEPRLALPLVAFFAMAIATRLLGKRLYYELSGKQEIID